MKKALNSILSVLLAFIMTASVVASDTTGNSDFPPEDDTEITIRKDEEKEPDCQPNYDESWLDEIDREY